MYSQVAHLVRFIYVVACVGAGSALLAATVCGPLDTPPRTAVVVVATIPPLLFCLAHYFLETTATIHRFPRGFALRSIATLVFLLFPPALLSLRYLLVPFDYSEVTRSVAVLAVATFAISRMLSHEAGSGNALVLLLTHMRLVMWDVWESPDVLKRLEDVISDREKVWSEREGWYVDPRGLRSFQETLGCRAVEGATLAGALGDRFHDQEVKILDVGGGDGVLTRAFITQLAMSGAEVVELRMLDPVKWEEMYRSELSPAVANGRIVVTRSDFGEASLQERYDVVLAAHSLYAACDRALGDVQRMEREVVRRLLTLRAEGGVVAIWLASGRGTSYAFKREALGRLVGRSWDDTTAETFHAVVVNLQVSVRTVDSVIDMTALMDEMKHGKPERLDAWLSYFLRVDMDAVPEIEKEDVRELLRAACRRVDELGETEIAEVLGQGCLDLTRQSVVLPHKTSLFLLQ